MLNGLDLFSGIGGITKALDPWVQPVAYCESDRYACAVLLSRIADGLLPAAPIWDDVRSLSARILPPIDIISGGFPCQDISVAGSGGGLGGSRSELFFDIIRLVGEIRPAFIFLENSPAITIRGLDRVLLEFSALGYDCRWTIVSAAEMGAVHIRERWFLLAHAYGDRLRPQHRSKIRRDNPKREGQVVSYGPSTERRISWPSERRVQPRVGRTGDGIPHRMDRRRCCGNSVHIEAAQEAFQRLMGIQ